MSQRPAHAKVLFAPLGPTYDRVGAVLSFGQDPRWRRLLVGLLPGTGGRCSTWRPARASSPTRSSGTAFASRGSTRAPGCSPAPASASATGWSSWRRAADALPFPDASFDHLTFTYLLRYVDDPGSTLVELARVVRPGGTVAMLEFGLPHGVWRPPWNLWVDVGLPLAGRLDLAGLARGWPVPRPVDPRIPRAASGAGAARALARRGDRGRPGAPYEPRRRVARLGATWAG